MMGLVCLRRRARLLSIPGSCEITYDSRGCSGCLGACRGNCERVTECRHCAAAFEKATRSNTQRNNRRRVFDATAFEHTLLIDGVVEGEAAGQILREGAVYSIDTRTGLKVHRSSATSLPPLRLTCLIVPCFPALLDHSQVCVCGHGVDRVMKNILPHLLEFANTILCVRRGSNNLRRRFA